MEDTNENLFEYIIKKNLSVEEEDSYTTSVFYEDRQRCLYIGEITKLFGHHETYISVAKFEVFSSKSQIRKIFGLSVNETEKRLYSGYQHIKGRIESTEKSVQTLVSLYCNIHDEELSKTFRVVPGQNNLQTLKQYAEESNLKALAVKDVSQVVKYEYAAAELKSKTSKWLDSWNEKYENYIPESSPTSHEYMRDLMFQMLEYDRQNNEEQAIKILRLLEKFHSGEKEPVKKKKKKKKKLSFAIQSNNDFLLTTYPLLFTNT